MTAPVAKMMVYAGDKLACVKISGRANFNFSLDFKTVVTELHRKGYRNFAIDLSECVLMDSTFLGVLTGFGLTLSEGNGESTAHLVKLFNPNARIVELLENLGVLNLFSVCQGDLPTPQTADPQVKEAGSPSRVEVTRNCLEAHNTLMAINADNVVRFKEVAKFLAEDLKKLEPR